MLKQAMTTSLHILFNTAFTISLFNITQKMDSKNTDDVDGHKGFRIPQEYPAQILHLLHYRNYPHWDSTPGHFFFFEI
jgi:hypothetical protein